MKRKIPVGGGIGLAVVTLIALIVVGFFPGDVVKTGMETVGPKVAQTSPPPQWWCETFLFYAYPVA